MNEWSEWGINEAAFWYKYGLDSLVHDIHLEEVSKSGVDTFVRFTIESRSHTHPWIVFHQEMSYDFHSSGDLVIHHKILPDVESISHYDRDWFPLSYLPKVGLRFTLAEGLQNISWFGRGPHESYPDRATGYKTGLYRKEIQEIEIPYIIPQDFDNRTGLRWLGIHPADGQGLLITSDAPFNCSIDPYENLDEAWYPFQLVKTANPVLNIDHKVTGVGGTPVRVRPIYRTYPEYYEYKLLLRPLSRNADMFQLSNVQF